MSRQNSLSGTKSTINPINVENELEHFVSQIEENTYTILSVKQKFKLMDQNCNSFKNETNEKLNSFDSQIKAIENHFQEMFQSFNQRLDYLELLGFKPETYHPSKIININNSLQITSTFYSANTLYIGTNTSLLLVYGGVSMQFIKEIGPLDDFPIVEIGIVKQTGDTVVAAKTNDDTIHIINVNNPSEKITIHASIFVSWPSNLSSPYKLVTFDNNIVRFYDESTFYEFTSKFKNKMELSVNAKQIYPGFDRIYIVNEKNIMIYKIDTDIRFERSINLPFPPKLISSSRLYFVASGDCNDVVIVNVTNGDYRIANVGGPSRFLFCWGSYFFRVGDDTFVQCRDIALKNNVVTIGDPKWWPHSDKLSTCNIIESVLITTSGSKCVLWN